MFNAILSNTNIVIDLMYTFLPYLAVEKFTKANKEFTKKCSNISNSNLAVTGFLSY